MQSQTLYQAMRYGILPGGKRIRPILTLAAGEWLGAARAHLLSFACAVEMTPVDSLIHDDLPALDDDDLRRGVLAAHKVFGEGMALLAGDGLLTEAFHLLSSAEPTRGAMPELVVQAIHELARAAGALGLVGGQAPDLEAKEKTIGLATVELIHVRKTGALILAALRIGAQVAKATSADLARLSRYGEYLGLAFQIADDMLDSHGGECWHGSRVEPQGAEEVTYPSVVGIVVARERLREFLTLSLVDLETFGARGRARGAC